MNGEPSEASTLCCGCGTVIECCEVSGDEPCPQAVCLRCLSLAVGSRCRAPHHGG